MTAIEGAAAGKRSAPEPDAVDKAAWPTQLGSHSWRYTARMAITEYRRDQCSDLAAALTYHAIGAAIPAVAVVLALVGVIGDPARTAELLVDLISDMGQQEVAEDMRDSITSVANSRTAGLALVIGGTGALWSASGYVSAFGRAMNRIYEIDEGRPFVQRRAINLGVTLVALVASTVLLVAIAGTRPVARAVGERVGLGDTFVAVWNLGRWPLMLVVMAVLVALLYYATPNIKQPRFRWLSIGAALAIAIWVAGSVGFALYVSHLGSYDQTYGSLAGVFILLLWLHLTNQALLLGAEFNSELERARELEAGIVAEEVLQLPPRATDGSEKAARKRADDIARGRDLRRRSHRARAARARTQPRPTGAAAQRSSALGRAFGAAVLVGALFTRAGERR